MANPVSSQGATLKRGDGAGSETFTLVAKIQNITGPAITAPQIDVTTLDSTGREYIAGLSDGGEVSFDFLWDAANAQQQGVRTDLDSGVVRNFKLVINDPGAGLIKTTISFAAVVTAFGPFNFAVDTPVSVSVTLKISGDPTFVLAS